MEKNEYFSQIRNCRLCKSFKLKPFLNFGKVSLGNDLQVNQSNAIKSKKYPLVINKCQDCGHFQLSISVNPKKLYATNYTYLSGVGKSFVSHLENYASWAYQEFPTTSKPGITNKKSHTSLHLIYGSIILLLISLGY